MGLGALRIKTNFRKHLCWRWRSFPCLSTFIWTWLVCNDRRFCPRGPPLIKDYCSLTFIGIRFVIIIIFILAQGPPVDQGPKPGRRHLPKHLNTHRPPKSQQNKFCASVLIPHVQCFDISLSPWMGGFVGGWPTFNDGCLRVSALWLQVKTGSRPSYDLDKCWRLEGREGDET